MTKILDPCKRYVVGFLFDPSRRNVLLIRKQRPEWQRGKLNGIGGEVEPGETPAAAMTRECVEECGLLIPHKSWSLFVSLQDRRGWSIDFFYAVFDGIGDARSQTDEDVEIVRVSELDGCMTNLKWLIPMALTMRDETCRSFQIREV